MARQAGLPNRQRRLPPTSWGIAWCVVAILVGLSLLLVFCSVLSGGPKCTDRPGLVEPDTGFEDVQFCG